MSKSLKNAIKLPDLLKGSSIIELLITVGILATITALAGPSFRPVITKHQTMDAAQNLADALSLARNEALANGIGISVNANNGDWQEGWQTIYSANGNLFKRYQAMQQSLNIVDSQTTVQFDNLGRTVAPASFEFSNTAAANTQPPLCVRVMRSGIVEIDKAAC